MCVCVCSSLRELQRSRSLTTTSGSQLLGCLLPWTVSNEWAPEDGEHLAVQAHNKSRSRGAIVRPSHGWKNLDALGLKFAIFLVKLTEDICKATHPQSNHHGIGWRRIWQWHGERCLRQLWLRELKDVLRKCVQVHSCTYMACNRVNLHALLF